MVHSTLTRNWYDDKGKDKGILRKYFVTWKQSIPQLKKWVFCSTAKRGLATSAGGTWHDMTMTIRQQFHQSARIFELLNIYTYCCRTQTSIPTSLLQLTPGEEEPDEDTAKESSSRMGSVPGALDNLQIICAATCSLPLKCQVQLTEKQQRKPCFNFL